MKLTKELGLHRYLQGISNTRLPNSKSQKKFLTNHVELKSFIPGSVSTISEEFFVQNNIKM